LRVGLEVYEKDGIDDDKRACGNGFGDIIKFGVYLFILPSPDFLGFGFTCITIPRFFALLKNFWAWLLICSQLRKGR